MIEFTYQKIERLKKYIEENDTEKALVMFHQLENEENGPATTSLLQALNTKYNILHNSDSEGSVTSNSSDIYKLSELDALEALPGTSIVSCCMNRNDNLRKGLETWLQVPVDEIVIVDWSSEVPVTETLADIDDPRVKIIRVENESKWILTYAFNVGLRAASFNTIYKLDADIQISKDFLVLNQFSENEFIRGYWKTALSNGRDDQVYVNGSFGCSKANLIEIGFYNELIRTYGWDDSDLYERLSSIAGLATKYLNVDSVVHLNQKEEERTAYQDIASNNFLDCIRATEFNNQCNKYIGRICNYWSINRLQEYNVGRLSNNLWKCNRVSQDLPIARYFVEDSSTYASIHYIWNHASYILKNCISEKNIAKLVYGEYKSNVNFNLTRSLLGHGQESFEIQFFSNKELSYDEYLAKCLEQANDENKSIFAIALGNEFSHLSLGVYGSKVEIITLPQDMLVEIVHSRKTQIGQVLNISDCSFVESSDYTAAYNKYRKNYVYIDAQHGLGNRIRAIASAATIAAKIDYELVVVWEQDMHCECRFSDLFDYSDIVIEKSFIENALPAMDVYNYMEIEVGASKDKEIMINGNNDLYLRSAYTFNSPLTDWESENAFIRQLTPVQEIEEIVNGFDLTNAIAAHVRMEAGAGLDDNPYDSVDNWTQQGHDQLHFWREKSHYSHFIKRIDQLFLEQPNLKLFLATDSAVNYKVFEEYYGDKLIFLKRDVYDRSREQIKYGLADVILLSKCQRLLGSTWSSFSELAMRMSDNFTSIEMSGTNF